MKMIMTRINIISFFLYVCLLTCSLPVYSQPILDSLSCPRQVLIPRDFNICDSNGFTCTKFDAKQVILPGTLMLGGLIGLIDNDNNLNMSVNDAMTGLSNNNSCKIDNYLMFLPSASHLLMGSFGVKSRHNFKERFLISATAHASMLAMACGMKYAIHEQRPDFSNNHSFPSGHVAIAFTGAELMRMEYGTVYGIAGYAVATGVAFLRLYNNKHWFNDVLMGAGIGILCARIGHWLLPLERKLFKINDKNTTYSTIAAIPTYNLHDHSFMFSINAVF